MSVDFTIVPAGDAVILVAFPERLDPAINARVLWIASETRRAQIVGVRDVVPAFHSLAVHFDPLRTDSERLAARLEATAVASRGVELAPAATHRVPVCYGGIYGPDLEAVAELSGLGVDDVVVRHTAPTYRVYMVGFTPGFAYLAPVDPAIAVPRRATPRVRVPAGSVGIAGQQTGIYPSETPGGWMLVGRTPLRPFQPAKADPFLVRPGDAVQFVPVDADEYHRLTGTAGSR